MRIVIALCAFKGSLSASEACQAARSGFAQRWPRAEILAQPISDGGDGLLESLLSRFPSAQRVKLTVTGPLGVPVETQYVLVKINEKKTVFIETAKICGLTLVPHTRRNPMMTTTYGVGETIRHAMGRRAKTIYVGLGGSATQDGGAGLAQALGAKLLDKHGKPIGLGCAWLGALDKIIAAKLDPRLKKIPVIALSDVTNVLLGPQGTAHVYAPQKGATPEQVGQIEANLSHFAKIIERDLDLKIVDIPGAGAAGGMGAGLAAFCRSKILPGTQALADTLSLKKLFASADMIVVGEGRLDEQTLLYGKAPSVLAAMGKAAGKKVCGIFGQIRQAQGDPSARLGLDAWQSLESLSGSPEAAIKNPAHWIAKAAEALANSMSPAAIGSRS
ncbi:MAG: glycerate kinase [Elusimicrobia bacterium]|nr:glycerate kinase [Elusimicrobiota bacterium]